ncbi:hypothetical protein YC2023_050874 [Brassica napus]
MSVPSRYHLQRATTSDVSASSQICKQNKENTIRNSLRDAEKEIRRGVKHLASSQTIKKEDETQSHEIGLVSTTMATNANDGRCEWR